MSLHYNLGNANIVVDSLNRLFIGNLANMDKERWELVKNIHYLSNFRILLLDSENDSVFVEEVVLSSLSTEIKQKQIIDPIEMKIKCYEGGKKWYLGSVVMVPCCT